MSIKSYRTWFLCSLIFHALVLYGLNSAHFPAPKPPEQVTRVKIVKIQEPPKPKPKPVVEPVVPIPPEPKPKPQVKKTEPVGVPKPKKELPKPPVKQLEPKPVVTPTPPRPEVKRPEPTPPQSVVKPQPVVKQPPAAAPAVMRSDQGKNFAAPPGIEGSMGQQGTVKGPPPPPPPPPGPTYDASSLGGPAPGYPKQAQEDELEGSVTVAAHVKPDGSFTASIARGSGHDVLDKAALVAIRSWRFKPAMKDGEPTSGTVSVRFTFSGGKVRGEAL